MPLPTAYSEDALAQLVQDENSKFRSPRDLAKWCKNNETIVRVLGRYYECAATDYVSVI